MHAVHTLTIGELKVFELARQPLHNKEIGVKLHISERTVRFHLANIYRKLGMYRMDIIHKFGLWA